jgi:hypothetical protein
MPRAMLAINLVVSRPEISNNTHRPAWPVIRCRATPSMTALDAPLVADAYQSHLKPRSSD